MSQRLNEQIVTWKNNLLDFSKRNLSLYGKTGKYGLIEISFPELEKLLKQIFEGKKKEFIIPKKQELISEIIDEEDFESISSCERESELTARCYKLHKNQNYVYTNIPDSDLYAKLGTFQKKNRETQQEKGFNIFYLTVGTLNWCENKESDIFFSPLIFKPARLERQTQDRFYKLILDEEDFFVNPTLKEFFAQSFSITLPDLDTQKENYEDFINWFEECRQLFHSVNRNTFIQDWQINPLVTIGLFKFDGIEMYEDLQQNNEQIIQSSLCNILAGEIESLNNGITIDPKTMDESYSPDKIYTIKDCDSTQLESILAVQKGLNIVLDGPPGTGKSQTIANIIADFIAHKKTVLFVCEKIAALNVVKQRLEESHLGDFCLNCHDPKQSRGKIIQELARCTNLKREPLKDYSRSLNELQNVRLKLNQYVRDLHVKQKDDIEKRSLYVVLGELASYMDITSKTTWRIENPFLVSYTKMKKWEQLLEKLRKFINLPNKNRPWSQEHVWFDHPFSKSLPSTKIDDLFVIFDGLSKYYGKLRDVTVRGKLFPFIDSYKDPPSTINHAQQILQQTPFLLKFWFQQNSESTVNNVNELELIFHDRKNFKQENGFCYDLEIVQNIDLKSMYSKICNKSQEHRLIEDVIKRYLQKSNSECLHRFHDVAIMLVKKINSEFLTPATEIMNILDSIKTKCGISIPQQQTIDELFLLCTDIQQYSSDGSQIYQIIRSFEKNQISLDGLFENSDYRQHAQQGKWTQKYLEKQEEFSQFIDKLHLAVITFSEITGLDISSSATLSKIQLLKDICVLLLQIHSFDDSWIPSSATNRVILTKLHDKFCKAQKSLVQSKIEKRLYSNAFVHDGIEVFRQTLPYRNFIKALLFRDKQSEVCENARALYKIEVDNNRTILRDAQLLDWWDKKITDTINFGKSNNIRIPEIEGKPDFDSYIQCFKLFKLLGQNENMHFSFEPLIQKLKNPDWNKKSLENLVNEFTILFSEYTNMVNKEKGIQCSWKPDLDFSLASIKSIKEYLQSVIAEIKKGIYFHQCVIEFANEVHKKILDITKSETDSNLLFGLTLPVYECKREHVKIPKWELFTLEDLVFAIKNMCDSMKSYKNFVSQFLPLITKDSMVGWEDIPKYLKSIECIRRNNFLYDQKLSLINQITGYNWNETSLELLFQQKKCFLENTKKFPDISQEQFASIAWGVDATSSNISIIPSSNFNEFTELVSEYSTIWQSISDCEKSLLNYLESESQNRQRLDEILQLPWETKENLFIQWKNNQNTFSEYNEYKLLEKQLKENEIIDFSIQLQNGRITADDPYRVLVKRFYQLWLDEFHKNNPEYDQFKITDHETLIKNFKKLDKNTFEINRHRIRQQFLDNTQTVPPEELTILRKESNKKKRFKPLRQLFSEIPHLVSRLKPCLMMSPQAVSIYLKSWPMQFDLVVFDEASQIKPWEAINAIFRGKQLVVAGDEKQLPPSNFFTTVLNDSEEDSDENSQKSELDEYESLLKVCKSKGFTNKRLLWHYRSLYEPLIAFSNRYFYDNQLVTFPNPEDIDFTKAIEFIYLPNGRWRANTNGISAGGCNPIEANKTVELIIEHLKKHPDKSLGVITFNQKQQELIESLLERTCIEDEEAAVLLNVAQSETQEQPLFIKNLETVQGDERDFIILSVGYGPNERDGRIRQNFGPLTKEGGERRLNVAITRAKEHITVLSSMKAEQFDASNSKHEGIKVLQEYLQYAEQGVKMSGTNIDSYRSAEQPEADSPFELEVEKALCLHGLKIDRQVGCSGYRIDLAVRHPVKDGKYVLAIECDGRTYHCSATARDRDRLRQEILESRGWRFCRIWSTDWVENPERQIQRVLEVYKKSCQED